MYIELYIIRVIIHNKVFCFKNMSIEKNLYLVLEMFKDSLLQDTCTFILKYCYENKH